MRGRLPSPLLWNFCLLLFQLHQLRQSHSQAEPEMAEENSHNGSHHMVSSVGTARSGNQRWINDADRPAYLA